MLIILTDLNPSVAVRIFFPISPENGDDIYEWRISIIKTLTIPQPEWCKLDSALLTLSKIKLRKTVLDIQIQ